MFTAVHIFILLINTFVILDTENSVKFVDNNFRGLREISWKCKLVDPPGCHSQSLTF
jgi:hypothetical protein